MKNRYGIAMVGCVVVGLAGAACGTAQVGDEVRADGIGAEPLGPLVLDPADIAHACAHVGVSSYSPVTATASPTHPTVTDHVAYSVTLPGGGPYSGSVVWEVEENHVAVYVDPDATVSVSAPGVTVTDVNGGPVTITPAECPQPDGGQPDYGTSDRGLYRYYEFTLSGATPPFDLTVQLSHDDENPVLALFENID